MDASVAFGFLPASTLHSINELGNWKMRSAAIDQVQRGLAGLTPAQAQQLAAQLPAFVGFVLQLLHDHNFKVVAAGLATLADAARHLGPRLQPHVSTLVPVLHEKLLDQRDPVAAAASRACVSLMQATHSSTDGSSEVSGFVNTLLQLHEAVAGVGGTQDASALLEVLLWAQLKAAAPGALEGRAAVRLLLGAAQQQAAATTGSSSSKQHALAMEGFALLTDSLGAKLPALLKQAGASDLAVTQVLTQCRQLQRPLLAPDGSVQHNSAVLAAEAAADAAVAPISSGGSSFRLTAASAGEVDSTRIGGGGAQQKLISGNNSSSSKLGVADSDGGSAWHQQQQLPPGSLGAFAAHAELLLSTTSSIAAAATASRGGSTINTGSSSNGLGSRPVSGSIHTSEGSYGPGSEHQQLLHSGGTHGAALMGRGSGGSISSIASAAAAAGQQVQVQLSHMQLNSGSEGSARGTLRRPGQAWPGQHAEDADSSISTGVMNSQAATAAGPGSVAQNMRYQHQLDSSHQQPGFNAAGNQGASAAQTSSSDGGWSSAVAGGGWAPSDPAASLESAPLCSGRAEAMSPNRGERLANLKRRQVEKRATSAVGSTRASNPWDSNDSSISTATAALSAAGDASLTSSLTGAEGLLQARRASTAGGSPGSSLTSSWRLSNAGAASVDGAGSGSEGGAAPPAHIGRGPLLNWHIPTGADGRFITPSAVISTQQHQQHQQQFGSGNGGSTSSQQPWGEAARGGSSSPSGWGSSLSASRAVQGHVQAGTNSSQQQQQQQQPYRSVSAAAVLTATGSDAQALDSSNGSPGQRSSRFQQVNGGGSASPPPVATATTGPGSPLSSSRLNSGSGLWMLRQQQQQQQAQGLRTQSAAAALGAAAAAAAAAGAGEWGSTTSSRLGSAGAPLSSTGGLHTATLGSHTSGSGSHQQPGVFASGAGASGGPGSPSRQMAPSLSGRSNGLRGVLGLETRPAAVCASALAGDADLEAVELSPLSDPEATLRQTLLRLQQANTAARKEMDWQAQLEALLGARRLVAHHAEVLRPAARELILAALPAVEELRSTTARMAIMLFQELPGAISGFERELDDMVLVLLKRAGDLSTAGRDNFLAQQADKALSGVCNAVSESRALSALVAAGAKHKSPHVRCRAAAHLDEVAAGGAGLEALLRSGNWAVLDRVFKAAAGFLQEGSLDTRTYAKRLLWAVKAALRGNRADVDRLVSGVSPEAVQRRVVEVLEGLSGQPPPPPAASRGSSSGAPRLASRGTSSGCSTPTAGAAGFGIQPPFSAPPAGHAATAGVCGAFEGGPASASRAAGGGGYSSVGSTSGNSAARRALFGGGAGSGTGGYGLHVQGASGAAGGSGGNGSAAGSPVSPSAAGLLLGSGAGSTSGRRRRSVATGGDADGSERRLLTGPPPGPPGPMSPELQEAVEQVGLHLASKDWRNRMDALRALTALLPALPEVPNGPLEGLLAGLVARLADGNAKVNQKALEVLCDVAGVLGLRVLLVLPALMPALTANLGSSNDKLRSCGAAALDATAAAVAAQPQGLLQGLAHAVASGSTRSRLAVIEKLQLLLPQVHQLQPQLTKLLLPSAFALALEARGELKPAASQLLASLAALLGSGSLLAAAGVVSSVVEQRVRELLLGYGGRSSG